MFDLLEALRPLNGKLFAPQDLKREFWRIRADHVEQISPDLDGDEMFRIARDQRWIVAEKNGKLRIEVPT